jgi:hypothetical protein
MPKGNPGVSKNNKPLNIIPKKAVKLKAKILEDSGKKEEELDEFLQGEIDIVAAPKGNNFNPDGRPIKEVDWVQFEKLCALQCTSEEMASVFGMAKATILIKVQEKYGEDFLSVQKRFSDTGKCSLRRNQYVMSKKSAAMAIWLGKQWLGQKETPIENLASEATNQQFIALMSQILQMQNQKERKIDDNNTNADAKS